MCLCPKCGICGIQKKVRVQSKKARGKLAPSAGNGFHNTSSLTNAIKVKSG